MTMYASSKPSECGFIEVLTKAAAQLRVQQLSPRISHLYIVPLESTARSSASFSCKAPGNRLKQNTASSKHVP